MSKRDEFLRKEKILRLATIDKYSTPHIVPVWYLYSGKKIYIGTNTKTEKARNVKSHKKVSFCVDVGINAPGAKMKKKDREKLNHLIKEFNLFKSINKISSNEVEFILNDDSVKKYKY